jgi:hypothetical protein
MKRNAMSRARTGRASRRVIRSSVASSVGLALSLVGGAELPAEPAPAKKTEPTVKTVRLPCPQFDSLDLFFGQTTSIQDCDDVT